MQDGKDVSTYTSTYKRRSGSATRKNDTINGAYIVYSSGLSSSSHPNSRPLPPGPVPQECAGRKLISYTSSDFRKNSRSSLRSSPVTADNAYHTGSQFDYTPSVGSLHRKCSPTNSALNSTTKDVGNRSLRLRSVSNTDTLSDNLSNIRLNGEESDKASPTTNNPDDSINGSRESQKDRHDQYLYDPNITTGSSVGRSTNGSVSNIKIFTTGNTDRSKRVNNIQRSNENKRKDAINDTGATKSLSRKSASSAIATVKLSVSGDENFTTKNEDSTACATSIQRSNENKPKHDVNGTEATKSLSRKNSSSSIETGDSAENDRFGRQNDLQYASDVVKDVFCTPCGDDGAKEKVSKYCPKCQEYLCLACARCHQRMKATRNHVLNDLESKDHSYAMVIEKCCYHPDRSIEMYCRTHDMVYCTRCIATEHRSCTGVTDIENAAEDDNCTIREVQKLQDDMKVFYDQLEMCNKKKESALVATEEQCSDIAVKIKAVKRDMTNHLEKLERDAMDALKKTKTDIKNELETDMSNVNKMIGTVEERSKKMERAAHMDNVQKFVQVKLSQKVSKDVRKLHEENKAKREKAISCTDNEQISKDFMKMQNICKINTFEQ